MEQLKLFSKVSDYLDEKTGTKKRVESFYLLCGNKLVPIQVKFFGRDDKKDYQYKSRCMVLSAFAEPLPEKTVNAHENADSDTSSVA